MNLPRALGCLVTMGLVGCTGFRAREPSAYPPHPVASCAGKPLDENKVTLVKEAYLVGKKQLQAHIRVRGCSPRPIEVCSSGDILTVYPGLVELFVLPTPEEQACTAPFTTQVFDLSLESIPVPLAKCKPSGAMGGRIQCELPSG